jgi:hypothetical protein
VTLVRENYIDFGPTFAAEKLAEDHGLKVSRETLRKWMQDAGMNQTGFIGDHKAWKISHDQRKFRKPFFNRSPGARSALGA